MVGSIQEENGEDGCRTFCTNASCVYTSLTGGLMGECLMCNAFYWIESLFIRMNDTGFMHQAHSQPYLISVVSLISDAKSKAEIGAVGLCPSARGDSPTTSSGHQSIYVL